MGKEIGLYFKYNLSKISTQTVKKTILSSLAVHTSSASNLTRTFISSQLENKDSTAIQNTSGISNTDDIHSCATPKKISVFMPHLNPLFDIIDHYFTSCTC